MFPTLSPVNLAILISSFSINIHYLSFLEKCEHFLPITSPGKDPWPCKSIYDSSLLKFSHVSGQASLFLFSQFCFVLLFCFVLFFSSRFQQREKNRVIHMSTPVCKDLVRRSLSVQGVKEFRSPSLFLFGRVMVQNRSNCFPFTF